MSQTIAVSVASTVNGEQDVQSTEQQSQVLSFEEFNSDISMAYPWYAAETETMRRAGYEMWLEAYAKDDKTDPDAGMKDKDTYSKAVEAYVKSRDARTSEQQIKAAKREFDSSVRKIQTQAKNAAEAKQRMSMLIHHALSTYLSVNPQRGKNAVRRSEAMDTICDEIRDHVVKSDVDKYAHFGATASVLFGATANEPLIGTNGVAYEDIAKASEIKPMAWTKIEDLSPLVVRTSDSYAEVWAIRPHVETDVCEFISLLTKPGESLPRTMIRRRVTDFLYESTARVAVLNPNDPTAQREAKRYREKWLEAHKDDAKPLDANATATAGTTSPKAQTTVTTTVTEDVKIVAPPGSTNGVPPAPATEVVAVPHNPTVNVAKAIDDASKPIPESTIVKPQDDKAIGIAVASMLLDDTNSPMEALHSMLVHMAKEMDHKHPGRTTIQSMTITINRYLHPVAKTTDAMATIDALTAKPTDAVADMATVATGTNVAKAIMANYTNHAVKLQQP